MRTAIKTYQSGGQIDTAGLLDDRYFPQPQGDVTGPVTPAPQAVQPTSPPPAPLPETSPSRIDPNAPAPPFMRQGPPTAINTAAPFDDDADLPRKTQMETEAWKNTRSHRGGGDIIPTEPPVASKPQDHAEWSNYQEALDIFNRQDPKTQRSLRPQLQAMERRISTETRAKDKQAHADRIRTETAELRKIDGETVKTLQLPELNGQIDQALSDTAGIYDKVIKDGAPKDSEDMTAKRKASPLDTMSNTEQKGFIRQLLALNHQKQIDTTQASQILMLMGQAPERGTKGFNGLSGRAAANYKPDSKDLVGNYFVEVPTFGRIRVTGEMLKMIDDRRAKGYDAAVKYRDEMKGKREEAAKPGWVARQTQPAIDWLSQQVR